MSMAHAQKWPDISEHRQKAHDKMSTTKTAEPLLRGHTALKTIFFLSLSLSLSFFFFFSEPFLRISNKQTSDQATRNTFSWSSGWASETVSTVTVSADYDTLPTVQIQTTIMWKTCGTSTARNTAKKKKTKNKTQALEAGCRVLKSTAQIAPPYRSLVHVPQLK